MIDKIAISPYHDIYTNIALERQLFDSFNGSDTMLLWSNDACVVCGRNQNVHAEVDVDYANSHNISISRRYSGGGAVYQDRGNLNYTIYSSNDNISQVLDSIMAPLATLGINCVVNGRNDITVNNKKVSGFAYYSDDNYHMYHGTLLVDVDIDTMTQVLNPTQLKMQHNAIQSVKSRVANLVDFVDTNMQCVQDAIVAFHTNCGASMQRVMLQDTSGVDVLSSADWIFGQSPDFNSSFETQLAGSIYNISVVVHNNIVEQCVVYSDCLDCNNVDIVKGCIINSQYDQLPQLLDRLKHKLGV